MERFETDVTDAQWAVISPLLPPPSRLGRRRSDLREVFNALEFMLGTGCQWRAIPRCLAPFATVHNHFHAWRDDGTLERLPDALRTLARSRAGRCEEPTAAAMMSPSVKPTQSGGPCGEGAGKKTKGRKRPMAVDVEGLPIVMEVQDRDGAPAVILAMPEKAPTVTRLWADGGCQGPKLAAKLRDLGLADFLEMVEKPKESKGFTVLYRRWVVERTFAWMSRCRRLAKDFERTLESSRAWVRLAACRFLGRRLARGASA